jgi:hypothetical protein
MTATEKIKIFLSIDSLITEIENDKSTSDILKNRYAVRFIMLDNFNIFQDLSLQLIQIGVQTFGLETLLSIEDKDKWLTQDELKTAIKNIVPSSLVSPFSEIVRFYDEQKFRTFFNEISLLENTQDNLNRRIYIPLIGLQNRFSKFLDSFSRIAESAPVWSVKTGKSHIVTLYLTQNLQNIELPKEYRGLETMHDWLQFWKSNPTPEKIVCSSLPINVYAKHSQPDNIFTPVKIDSAYDFIEKYHNLSLNIPYKKEEEKFWQQLLSHISNNNFSFKAFTNNHIDIGKISIEKMLNKWTATDTTDFDRWLLKHYYLQNLTNENQYLTDIMKDCVDYSSLRLFREIALSIFVDTNNKKFIEERNHLLNLFDEQYKLPDTDLIQMKEKILNIAQSDTGKAILLCSGRFDFEKELFIGWYKAGKLKNADLKKVYPDFFAYLSDSSYNTWINSYIQSYKQAKIQDNYTNEIKNLIAEKNANEATFYQWYHGFELLHELLAKENPDKVYWIDGLGIEYLSLIKSLVEQSTFKIEKLIIAKTGIPSSTEHNKYENCQKIDDLDNYIHNNLYHYPQTIRKEIEIVKSIFNTILNQPEEKTVAIVSDHGLTALSRLVDSKKYTAKASHEGRYIKLDGEETIKDTDYIRHKNGTDNFKVALTHASLNTKPVREVHGGCTPEEILVPFIVISNKKSARTIEKNIETKQQTENVVSDTHKKKGFEEEEELF